MLQKCSRSEIEAGSFPHEPALYIGIYVVLIFVVALYNRTDRGIGKVMWRGKISENEEDI